MTTVIVTFAAVASGATARPQWSLIALAGTTGALACVSTLGAAVATAALAWGLQAGFVLGRHGDLALTPAATRAAIALVAVAVSSFIVATAVRAIRDRVRAGGRRRAGPLRAGPRRRITRALTITPEQALRLRARG